MPFVPYALKRFSDQVKRDGFARATAKRARILRDRPLHALRNNLDIHRDKQVCGMSLDVSVTSPFAQTHGAIDTIHTPYGTLDVMLGREPFTPADSIIDIGCGMGRPLAYLIRAKFPGKITGVEINPDVAACAQEWAQRYDNVDVICGDAFDLDLSTYTAFFMWKPMTPETFLRFAQKMEREIDHPTKLFFLSDIGYSELLTGRARWTLERQDWISRVHGIPQHGTPERYAVWRLDPAKDTKGA